MKPAGFWIRFWAMCIDGLLFLPFSGANMLASHFNARDAMVAFSIFGVLLANVYPSLCHWRWGKTLGKHLLDIKVISMDGSGLGGAQAVLRSSIDIGLAFLQVGVSVAVLLSFSADSFSSKDYNLALGTTPALWVMIGLSSIWCIVTTMTVVFSDDKRAAHDLIAGTRAIRTNVETVSEAPAPAPTL